MPCYSPLQAYRPNLTKTDGNRQLVFTKENANIDQPLEIPCGQCIGCRLEKSRQWAMRCLNEKERYENNCFLTLTFNPEQMPSDGSLHVRDMQLFMKKLRRKFVRGKMNPIRFFLCGEYGDNFGRPHYHILLFNHNFQDRVLWKKSNSGEDMFRSKMLEDLWSIGKGKNKKSLGYSTVQDVTFESCAYVARYIMKKVTPAHARSDPTLDNHYSEKPHPHTGEIHSVKPEFITMSRNPGIGTEWFDNFWTDDYPSDTHTSRGKQMRPPKFYDKLFEKIDSHAASIIRNNRIVYAKSQDPSEKTQKRILVKLHHKELTIKSLKRELK